MNIADVVAYFAPRAPNEYQQAKIVARELSKARPVSASNIRAWLRKLRDDPDAEPPRGWQYTIEQMTEGDLEARRGYAGQETGLRESKRRRSSRYDWMAPGDSFPIANDKAEIGKIRNGCKSYGDRHAMIFKVIRDEDGNYACHRLK